MDEIPKHSCIMFNVLVRMTTCTAVIPLPNLFWGLYAAMLAPNDDVTEVFLQHYSTQINRHCLHRNHYSLPKGALALFNLLQVICLKLGISIILEVVY